MRLLNNVIRIFHIISIIHPYSVIYAMEDNMPMAPINMNSFVTENSSSDQSFSSPDGNLASPMPSLAADTNTVTPINGNVLSQPASNITVPFPTNTETPPSSSTSAFSNNSNSDNPVSNTIPTLNLTPITVNTPTTDISFTSTTTSKTQISPSSNSSLLGSGITQSKGPAGMQTAAPVVTLTSSQTNLKTLNELLNANKYSSLTPYDRSMVKTLADLTPGVKVTNQQAATVAMRTHTDPSADNDLFNQNPYIAGAQQITARNKFQVPHAARISNKLTSFTRHKTKCQLNNDIFNNSELEEQYKNMIKQLSDCPQFIPIFTKFHILALSQIYQYLVGIYTSLTLTHIDDLNAYIILEQMYGLNRKSLIIQYLISLVERQLNQALLELFPNMPNPMAIHSGLQSLGCDNISRLDIMFADIEEVVLATFGIEAIPIPQWQIILKMLTQPSLRTLRDSVSTSSFNTIIAKLSTYITSNPEIITATGKKEKPPAFINTLTLQEQSDLVDFLDIVTAECSQTQQITDALHISEVLTSKSTDSLTEGDISLIKSMIQFYTLKDPLIHIIEKLQNIAPKIPDIQNLNQKDVASLKEFVTALLLIYEDNYLTDINFFISSIETLFTKDISQLSSSDLAILNMYKDSNAYLRTQDKNLALDLISNPALFSNLSAAQQGQLIDAISRYKNLAPLSDAQVSILDQLTQAIQAGNIQVSDLAPSQQEFYNAIITWLSQYSPGTYTQAQAQADLLKTFGPQILEFDSRTQKEQKPSALYILNLPAHEQLMLYCTFVTSLQVAQSRMEKHKKDVGEFSMLTLYQQNFSSDLLNYIPYSNYETLRSIYNNLSHDPETTLQKITPETITLLQHLIGKLLGTTKSKKTGILQSLLQETTSNNSFKTFFTTFNQSFTINFSSLVQKINAPNFNHSMLLPDEKTSISQMMKSYASFLSRNQSMKIPSSKTTSQGLPARESPLSNPNDRTAYTIASIIHAHLHFKNSRNQMVTSLSSVFNFLSSYTSLLHVNENEKNLLINKTFTKFAGYAHAIGEQLKNRDVGTMTPALFLYDPITLQHLSFLPILAKSIDNTRSAPLPTQAVDMALTAHPVPSDDTPSSHNNQIFLAPESPFTIPSLTLENPDIPGAFFSPKFFFKDKNGKAYGNQKKYNFGGFTKPFNSYEVINNPSISWLAKTQIPSIDVKTPPVYQYYANTSLSHVEGLYMNILILLKDTANSKSALARLYEQKIIAQPEWLNSAQGVIGMLRACLGDFVTAMTLDETIFDATLNYIIRLTLLQEGVPVKAGIAETQELLNPDYIKENINYWKNAAQEEIIEQTVGPQVTPKGT